jgi:hypothetical protein
MAVDVVWLTANCLQVDRSAFTKRTMDLLPAAVEMRVRNILDHRAHQDRIHFDVGDGPYDVTQYDIEALARALDPEGEKGLLDRRPTLRPPSRPGEPEVVIRDRAFARLADRLTTLVDRELLRDDNNYLAREFVTEMLDNYITDAVKQKRILRSQPRTVVDPVTALVHCDGGIDALQELRERLLGSRLNLDLVI